MIEFQGFPARMQFTPIPNIVFSSLLPQITDITELKVLLHFFELLYPKKGSLRFVSYSEIAARAGMVHGGKSPAPETMKETLRALVGKGTLLHLSVTKDSVAEDIYFLNNEANRRVILQIRNGEIPLSGLSIQQPLPVNAVEMPDIFTLYEQNIGMLTPLIADELKEALKHYPESWIKDAVKEAVSSNKRRWSTIARILERWATEGKDNGTYRGYPKKNTDPDKYVRGKYGHMVQR